MFGFFVAIDLAFLGANVLKINQGGWIPLLIGAVIYLLMSTWQKGRKILARRLKQRTIELSKFVDQILQDPPQKVPGRAIPLTSLIIHFSFFVLENGLHFFFSIKEA